jgi:hypothetical protein
MTDDQKLTIDGKEYDLASLTDEAKSQLMNIRVADQKIESAKQDIAIFQTARNAYARALTEALPKVSQ